MKTNKKSKWKDSTLIGNTFGILRVIELVGINKSNGGRIWKCKCDCGNECNVSTSKLNSGDKKNCGCIKIPYDKNAVSIGKKFGKLTVIKDDGIRKSNVIWLCKCECGGTKVVSSYHLKSNSVRSCGCLRSGELKGGVRNLGEGVAIMNKIIGTYKDNAKKNNRDFTLSNEQCKTLFLDKCFYCDEPPKRTFVNKRTGDSFTYNGIDRSENSIGYILENSVSCCTECNIRKSSASKDEFLEWIKKIYEKHFILCNENKN
jgi:hypothetical protein